MSATPPRSQEPFVFDPANRTRLAWSRTAIGFGAIGLAMLKFSFVAGLIVLVLSLPIWAVSHRMRGRDAVALSPRYLQLVTATVVIVALAALAVAIFGHSAGSLGQLLRAR